MAGTDRVSRGGQWWTAPLLIRDPSNGKLFINMYTWECVGGQWKNHKPFAIRSERAVDGLTEDLSTWKDKLP